MKNASSRKSKPHVAQDSTHSSEQQSQMSSEPATQAHSASSHELAQLQAAECLLDMHLLSKTESQPTSTACMADGLTGLEDDLKRSFASGGLGQLQDVTKRLKLYDASAVSSTSDMTTTKDGKPSSTLKDAKSLSP